MMYYLYPNYDEYQPLSVSKIMAASVAFLDSKYSSIPRIICCGPSNERTIGTPAFNAKSSTISQGDQDKSMNKDTPWDEDAHTAKNEYFIFFY